MKKPKKKIKLLTGYGLAEFEIVRILGITPEVFDKGRCILDYKFRRGSKFKYVLESAEIVKQKIKALQ